MTFGLCTVLMMAILCFLGLFQIHMTRGYDEILQNFVSIERGQQQINQLRTSAEKYAEARKELDYQEGREARERLNESLNRIEGASMDPSSLMAVRNIRELLSKIDGQLARMLQGEYDGLLQIIERCEDVNYLLDRIQTLELDYAAALYPRMNESMTRLGRALIVVQGLMLLETALLCLGFHQQIYAPIQRLVEGVQEISKGNFDCPDIELSKNDEFDYLASAINSMKRDLSSLIETQREKLNAERLLREAQFLALQSQVNPHFLFNVLGVTTATALEEGADKTVSIVESVSQMLRYSLRSMNTRVTLRDEISMVENYFFLQNQRFGDRISFTVEVDESVLEAPIPGMTIQPIVENAVIHGCEKLESGGWLRVVCRPDPEQRYAVVTVENNGGVMSEEQLRCFRAGQSLPNSGKSTGIGLANVRERMSWFYNRKDLMDCEAVRGEVNVVTLRYPLSGR